MIHPVYFLNIRIPQINKLWKYLEAFVWKELSLLLANYHYYVFYSSCDWQKWLFKIVMLSEYLLFEKSKEFTEK